MTQPLISVTVPIYKAEKYLSQCIDSLIAQTLEDIEIILVDDGSPDRCGDICDEYAQKDSRIKVIHKTNGGSASARQAGLDISSGLYYIVCDADDWIEPDMYEELYRIAQEKNADIVISGYIANYPDGSEVPNPTYTYTTQEQYIADVLSRQTDPGTCNKLIRMDLLRKYNLSYEIGINLGEDALILYKLLKHPLNIQSTPMAFYHYRRNILSKSYTNHITIETLQQLEYIEYWKQIHFNDKRYERIHTISMINLCFAAIRTEGINKDYYKKIASKVSVCKILHHRITTLKAIFIIFTKIFGLRVAKWIFSILYPIFYK